VRESVGKKNDMWRVGDACMVRTLFFVFGVPGRDSIRISTEDAEHKMRRYLALWDATGTHFSPFLVRLRLGDATEDALKTSCT
jgi:hypothetical protein